MDELPYHYHQLNPNELEKSIYLNDIKWIYDKVCGSNCYQLLEDIYLNESKDNKFITVLKDFLETNASYLNYDGRQFYAQLRYYLDDKIKSEYSLDESHIKELYEFTKNPPVISIVPLKNLIKKDNDEDVTTFKEKCFNLITRLVDTDRFVVSISTDKEEISVWDVRK